MGRLLFVVALLACGARAAGAQAPGDSIGRDSTLRVFFDCPGFAAGCDFDFLRIQITWVDWVRNREDADLHALVTTQGTGGGGDDLAGELVPRDDRVCTHVFPAVDVQVGAANAAGHHFNHHLSRPWLGDITLLEGDFVGSCDQHCFHWTAP